MSVSNHYLSNGSMSNNNKNPSAFSSSPPFYDDKKDQRLVQTPYGRGLVIRTRPRDGIQEIQLLDWKRTNQEEEDSATTRGRTNHPSASSATLYSPTDFASVPPAVGDDVVCLYGRGRIVAIHNNDNETNNRSCEVHLSSWRLAGRSVVQCHLQTKDVHVVQNKTRLLDMDAYERVRYAQEHKERASALFAAKKYDAALLKYAVAVDAVRYVQHDTSSSNELRADLLIVMITCCNNAATCCVQLQKYEEGIKFARNALVLLDALYEKRGMKIHSILKKEGLSDAKLFGEWKVKSYLLLGRSHAERQDYAKALEVLKRAHETIVEYTSGSSNSTGDGEPHSSSTGDELNKPSVAHLHTQDKEVKRLHAICVQRKKAERKREKQRAEAMFGASKTTPVAAAVPESVDKRDAPPASATNNGGLATLPSVGAVEPSSEKTMGVDMRNVVVEPLQNENGDLPGVMRQERLGAPPAASSFSPAKVNKRVSFSERLETSREYVPDDYDAEEELPWYDEHREALILSAGLLALTTVFFMRPRT